MAGKICLIGFMGSGKTTIGESLGRALACEWIDLDHFIEQKEGCTISAIFASKGESYFRLLEQKYLQELIALDGAIIATGGGVIVTDENRVLLKQEQTFYLYWKFETLYKRIIGDKSRPLATSYEALKARYEMRQPYYEESCTYKINCEGKSVEEIVKIIKEQINR